MKLNKGKDLLMTLKTKEHKNKNIITPFGDKRINEHGVVEGLNEEQEKHLSVLNGFEYTETHKEVPDVKKAEESKKETQTETEKPKRTRRTKKAVSEDDK